MSGWETTVNTGNPDYDRMMIDQYRQQAAANGMDLQVQQLPTGGYYVKGVPMGQAAPPPAPAYGGYGAAAPPPAPAYQQQAAPPPGYGQPAYASAGGPTPPPAVVSGGSGAAIADDAEAAKPLSRERIMYLRKVYGLLAIAAVIAVIAGAVLMNVGLEAYKFKVPGHKAQILQLPSLVVLMIQNPIIWYASFGALVLATFAASWVSKVPVLNVMMLFLVAALMGVEMVPSILIAQLRAGIGTSMSTDPVRDAGLMTVAVFASVTGYAFITRKDFSYLGATLSMGVVVLLCAIIFGVFLGSSIFALAVATLGALLAAGIILWVTSIVLRGPMDDAVGDALILLVQLRNLFMWLLEIFGSRN